MGYETIPLLRIKEHCCLPNILQLERTFPVLKQFNLTLIINSNEHNLFHEHKFICESKNLQISFQIISIHYTSHLSYH